MLTQAEIDAVCRTIEMDMYPCPSQERAQHIADYVRQVLSDAGIAEPPPPIETSHHYGFVYASLEQVIACQNNIGVVLVDLVMMSLFDAYNPNQTLSAIPDSAIIAPPYKLKNVTVVDGVLKASNLHFQNVSSWDCYGLIFFGWKKKNLLYFLKTKQKTHDSDTESCVSIELGFGSEGICKFT